MVVNDEPFKSAVITLGSDDEINFSFDELSHTYHRYTYRITHCNADWTQSELDAIDYLDGFNDRPIEDWENSVNTTRLYTNYQFRLPNDDARLKVSGNYKVEVFDDACYTDNGGGKYHINLWQVNRNWMLKAGILPEHITVTDLCTRCHPDLFWSHRKTGNDRGSLAAFIALAG